MRPEQRIAQILRALSLGMLFDLVCSTLAGLALGLMMAIGFSIRGVPTVEVVEQAQALAQSAVWIGLSLVIGSLISVAAGFLAAHLLRFNPYPWLGLMGTLLALVSFAGAGELLGTQQAMLASLITLSSVMAGGWLWLWVQR